jgi:hypothetical protein
MPDRNADAKVESEDWQVSWEAHRRRRLTFAMDASPAERLRWLEEMIALAHRSGALPRKRSGQEI